MVQHAAKPLKDDPLTARLHIDFLPISDDSGSVVKPP